MSEINTVALLDQMRVMANKAQGSSVEGTSSQASFNTIFQNTLGSVNQLQQNADSLKAAFEMGDANTSIGEVMVAAQKSNLAFEASLRVRNKVVQAYQDIMNMPI